MTTHKKRILCIDDDAENLELTKTYLELADYEAITAESVAEGLLLASSEHFDLYLVDLKFRDGCGLDLARQIKAFDKKTPLVFHSASAFARDIQQGLDAGAQA